VLKVLKVAKLRVVSSSLKFLLSVNSSWVGDGDGGKRTGQRDQGRNSL
jgi:hypothetical protein